MTKPDVDKLIAARELIARPGGWTQGEYGRDQQGVKIEITSWLEGRKPCQVCSVGAIAVARGVRPPSADMCAESRLLEDIVGGDLIGWNDKPRRTQEDVVAAFDRAIELARAS